MASSTVMYKRDKLFECPLNKLSHHFRAKVITPYNLSSKSLGDSNIQPLPKANYNVCNLYVLCYMTYVNLLCWYSYFGTLSSMNFELQFEFYESNL